MDTKFKVTYSDNTSKNMDMPPATSLKLPASYPAFGSSGYITFDKITIVKSSGLNNERMRISGSSTNGLLYSNIYGDVSP